MAFREGLLQVLEEVERLGRKAVSLSGTTKEGVEFTNRIESLAEFDGQTAGLRLANAFWSTTALIAAMTSLRMGSW